MAREFSSVFCSTKASRARRRSSRASWGNSAVLRSATTSSPLHDEEYEFIVVLKPSYHSGQLSEMSLFCGDTFVPPTALPPTFHCDPSCRLCQWQFPQAFWRSAECHALKREPSPDPAAVGNRPEPLPPLAGSGVLSV